MKRVLTSSRLFLFTLLMIVANFNEISAQRFGANLLLGANAAQINGDDLAGYNKVGLTGGIRTDYYLKPNMSLAFELLYSERGSQSELKLGATSNILKIKLNYIEVPVMFVIHDWYIEDPGYYKVKAEAGFSYGNLFNRSSINSFFEENLEDFNSNDFSFLIGATFKINKNIGFTTRYTRSMNRLYGNEFLVRDLFGYFLTFRFEYYLL